MNNCEHKIKETMVTFKDGTQHLERRCELCGKHLGYKAHKTVEESVLMFGKYKGKGYIEVAKEDPEYFHWLVAQPGIKNRTKNLVEEAFEKLYKKDPPDLAALKKRRHEIEQAEIEAQIKKDSPSSPEKHEVS